MIETHNWLAAQFEAEHPRLRAMAYRMLGPLAEAEDAVQEVRLHLFRYDTSTVSNLSGWLTTVPFLRKMIRSMFIIKIS